MKNQSISTVMFIYVKELYKLFGKLRENLDMVFGKLQRIQLGKVKDINGTGKGNGNKEELYDKSIVLENIVQNKNAENINKNQDNNNLNKNTKF